MSSNQRSSLWALAALLAAAGLSDSAYGQSVWSNGFEGPSDAGPSNSTIVLPLEVLGPAGTIERATFELQSIEGVRYLYLRCHACGYGDYRLDSNPDLIKATVRVNGGPEIALKHYTAANGGSSSPVGNADIVLLGSAAGYGGIGGGFHTVDMLVPVTGLRVGRNELVFEHRDARPPSIGFRIVRLDLLRSQSLNDTALAGPAFSVDDPRRWSAPLPAPTDVAQGQTLWRARNRLHDPFSTVSAKVAQTAVSSPPPAPTVMPATPVISSTSTSPTSRLSNAPNFMAFRNSREGRLRLMFAVDPLG